MLFTRGAVDVPLDIARTQLILTQISPRVGLEALRLNFEEFLQAIILAAMQCYPKSKDSEDAFEHILMSNILPFASRRENDNTIAYVAEDEKVAQIFKKYGQCLQPIFNYFACDSGGGEGDGHIHGHGRKSDFKTSKMALASPKATAVRKTMMKSATPSKSFLSSSSSSSPPPPLTMSVFSSPTQQYQQTITSYSSSSSSNCGHIHNLLSYTDFLRLMNDMGLSIAIQVTSYDLGHIYLSVMQYRDFTFRSRNIEYAEFCEILVKLALLGFRGKKVSIENKTNALFMFMARQCDNLVSTLMHGKGSITAPENSVMTSQLIVALQKLRAKFASEWAKDGHIDYLDDDEKKEETSALDMIKHLTVVSHSVFEDNITSSVISPDSSIASPAPVPIIRRVNKEDPEALIRMKKLIALRPKTPLLRTFGNE